MTTPSAAVDRWYLTTRSPETRPPQRVQRRRGVALPTNTVYIGRPGKFGNPYRCDRTPPGRAEAVRRYRAWLATQPALIAAARAELTGRDLACWCPLDGHPCPADVLLELTRRSDS